MFPKQAPRIRLSSWSTFTHLLIHLISYSHEFACCFRYVPLSRAEVPLSTKSITSPGCSFPSLSTSDEIGKVGSSTLIRCKFESVEPAAKVCSAFAGLYIHNQGISPVQHTTIAGSI